MTVSLNMNGVNQIPKGTVIYEKDEPLQSVCLVLKGRVLVQSNGVKTIFSSGNFLGACDVDLKVHSFSYTAYDDAVVFAFPISSQDDLRVTMDKKPEYRGLLNTSTNYFIAELNRMLAKMEDECVSLRQFVLAQYEFYQKTGEENGVLVDKISSVDVLKKKKMGDISLCKELDYYLACTMMPVNAQKNFFMGSSYISEFHFEQQKNCVFSLLIGLQTYVDLLQRCFQILIGGEKNLFLLFSRMALDLAHSNIENRKVLLAVDEVIERINQTEEYLTEKAGAEVYLDRERMENTYYALLSGENYEKKVEITEKKALRDLDDSLTQLLDYSELSQEDKDEFESAVKAFMRLSDKESRTDEVSKIRKTLTKVFYPFYEKVLFKSFGDERTPVAVQLFLKYGFVSEKLLSEEKLEELMGLEERNQMKDGCKVYHLSEWLRAIYKREQEPSRNEFDMDYEEFLRHEKSTGFMDDEEYEFRLKDAKERLHFEISNMFAYANRMVHGRLSSFVPVLYEEALITEIEKSYLTADRLNTVVNKIQNIDYSIFYRERQVSYEKVKITKETIVKKCLPNIILFPIYGKNGIMWQDIVGKKRDTSARFLYPVLLETSMEKEMMKVFGNFRWEICRTEQGMQWNNLHYPSLTSEYTDYLQFYRRNPDLSAEARTKVKSQLTHFNNRHRDVFTKDYMDWLLREAKGGMKVNKVARGILATYVPFSNAFREKLKEQTIFAEAYKKFRINLMKRKKEVAGSCGRFEREGLPIPEELRITREFYDL